MLRDAFFLGDFMKFLFQLLLTCAIYTSLIYVDYFMITSLFSAYKELKNFDGIISDDTIFTVMFACSLFIFYLIFNVCVFISTLFDLFKSD